MRSNGGQLISRVLNRGLLSRKTSSDLARREELCSRCDIDANDYDFLGFIPRAHSTSLNPRNWLQLKCRMSNSRLRVIKSNFLTLDNAANARYAEAYAKLDEYKRVSAPIGSYRNSGKIVMKRTSHGTSSVFTCYAKNKSRTTNFVIVCKIPSTGQCCWININRHIV